MDLEDIYHKTVNSLARQLKTKDIQTRKALELLDDVKHLKSDHVHLVKATCKTLDQCSRLDSETRVLISAVQRLWARLVKARYASEIERLRRQQPAKKMKKADVPPRKVVQGEEEADDESSSSEDDDEVETYFSADETTEQTEDLPTTTDTPTTEKSKTDTGTEEASRAENQESSEQLSQDTEAVSLDGAFYNLTEYLNSKCGESSPGANSHGKSSEVKQNSPGEEADDETETLRLPPHFVAPDPCKLLQEENKSMKDSLSSKDKEIEKLQERLAATKADFLSSEAVSCDQRAREERNFVRMACRATTKISLLQQRIGSIQGKNKSLVKRVQELEKKLGVLEKVKRSNDNLQAKILQAKQDNVEISSKGQDVAKTLFTIKNDNENLKAFLKKTEESLFTNVQVEIKNSNLASKSSTLSKSIWLNGLKD